MIPERIIFVSRGITIYATILGLFFVWFKGRKLRDFIQHADRWDIPVFQYVFRTYAILIFALVKTNDSIWRLPSDKVEQKATDLVNIPSVYIEESAQITGRNPANEFFSFTVRDFRFLPRNGLELRSSGLLRSDQWVFLTDISGFLDPLMKGPIGCPETSVRNNHYSLRKNPEQPSSFLDLFTDFTQLHQQPNGGTR